VATITRVDPVTFGVISGRLSGIVQEMQDSIFRTGYSTIVRESHDASCMILDAEGNVVGEHVIAPLHITALPIVVRRVREIFEDDLAQGDVFLTNHPYAADVTHSIDMAVTSPVFAGGRVVAFCASIAHKSDLGGAVPGTANGSARELFQEGILYPPVRYMKRGALVRDVDAILRANSRTPELVAGDIRGQIGVARIGERRLLETIERYGLETVLAVFEEKQDKTELRVRRALAAWEDGVAEAETRMEGDSADDAIRYHVRVEKIGDRLIFDFTESSDQTTMPVNVRPSIVRGCCYYALIGMIDPQIENNGGLARAVETRVRPGSVLDPHFPAPTNAYMTTAAALTEAIVAALSRLARDRRVAGVGGVGALAIAGERADATPFQTYELLGSAYGARSGADGLSGISVLLSNSRTAPIEIMETEFPVRFRRFELIADSGGAGTFRGGLGYAREYVMGALRAQLTLRGGKHAIAASGIDGGADGRLGSLVVGPGTPEARAYPSRFSGVALSENDVVRVEKAGGGGLGPPAARSFESILDDVLDGYVTARAAVAEYGIDPQRLEEALADWERS
jgi:N-methylhydantoinase B